MQFEAGVNFAEFELTKGDYKIRKRRRSSWDSRRPASSWKSARKFSMCKSVIG